MRTRTTPESALKTQCTEYLKFRRDVFVWRNNTGRRGRVSYGFTGSGDFIGIVIGNGRHIEIELKAPGETQSTVQEEHQKRIEAAGGIYLLVTSVDELAAALDAAVKEAA